VNVFFDIEPSFPCFAVLIDLEHALVVRSKISHDERSKKRWRERAGTEQWERIGFAAGFRNSDISWHEPAVKALFEEITIY
jgi:hypothetical protein